MAKSILFPHSPPLGAAPLPGAEQLQGQVERITEELTRLIGRVSEDDIDEFHEIYDLFSRSDVQINRISVERADGFIDRMRILQEQLMARELVLDNPIEVADDFVNIKSSLGEFFGQWRLEYPQSSGILQDAYNQVNMYINCHDVYPEYKLASIENFMELCAERQREEALYYRNQIITAQEIILQFSKWNAKGDITLPHSTEEFFDIISLAEEEGWNFQYAHDLCKKLRENALCFLEKFIGEVSASYCDEIFATCALLTENTGVILYEDIKQAKDLIKIFLKERKACASRKSKRSIPEDVGSRQQGERILQTLSEFLGRVPQQHRDRFFEIFEACVEYPDAQISAQLQQAQDLIRLLCEAKRVQAAVEAQNAHGEIDRAIEQLLENFSDDSLKVLKDRFVKLVNVVGWENISPEGVERELQVIEEAHPYDGIGQFPIDEFAEKVADFYTTFSGDDYALDREALENKYRNYRGILEEIQENCAWLRLRQYHDQVGTETFAQQLSVEFLNNIRDGNFPPMKLSAD